MKMLALFTNKTLTLEPDEIRPTVLVGADTIAMLGNEETMIERLEERRHLIDTEIERLTLARRDTQLAIDARVAARNVFIAGGLLPGRVV